MLATSTEALQGLSPWRSLESLEGLVLCACIAGNLVPRGSEVVKGTSGRAAGQI